MFSSMSDKRIMYINVLIQLFVSCLVI